MYRGSWLESSWRLFSGHLAHLSWSHYVMDSPVFILLYATYSKRVASTAAHTFVTICRFIRFTFSHICWITSDLWWIFRPFLCCCIRHSSYDDYGATSANISLPHVHHLQHLSSVHGRHCQRGESCTRGSCCRSSFRGSFCFDPE